MIRHFLFACGLLLTALSAQTPVLPPLELERIERPWPSAFAGTDTDVACGRFVAEHPAMSAVVVRNGQLYLWFGPAHFAHCVTTGVSGVGAIATVPSTNADPDLLAVATPAGLRLLRYVGGTFVDALPGQGVQTAWAGTRDLESAVFGGSQPIRCLLAHGIDWVRATLVDDAGTLLPPLSFSAPPGVTVFDVTLVDWVPGGLPEIAVLLSTGTCVLAADGTFVTGFPQAAVGGVIQALPRNAVPTFAQARNFGGVWRIETFVSQGTFAPIDGGVLPVGQPVIGLAAFDANGDAFRDLVVSTGESLRRVLVGRPEGFSAASAHRVDFLDVDAADLPTSPLSNQAPLCVCDMDRDGNDDFVVAQRPTDQLVVTIRVRPQLQFAMLGFQDEGGTLPSLAFTLPLGVSPGIGLPGEDLTGNVVLFLRLELPGVLMPNTALDAIVYPRFVQGATPAAGDPASLASIAHLRYAVPAGSEGKSFSLMLPLPETDVYAPAMGNVPRFVVEFSLVEATAGKPLKGSAPVFVEAAFGNPPWSQMLGILDPSSEGPAWWLDEILQLLLEVWNAGLPPTGSVGEPPDARYFGAVVALKEPKVGGAPSVPTGKSGSGVAH